MSPVVVFPSGYLVGSFIPLVLFVFGLVIPGFVLAYTLIHVVQLRGLAAEADEIGGADSALAPGPAVLCGRVRLAQDEAVAVRVEITQQGEEFQWLGQQKHRWYEVERRTIARPFYVDDSRGHSVRVEPNHDVTLVDHVDKKLRGTGSTRVRVAELSDGEAVYALGTLERGEDPEAPNAGAALILRPGSEDMLLSAHPLSAQYDRPANMHALFAVATMLFLGLSLVMGGPIAGRMVVGVDDYVTVAGKYTQQSRGRKGRRGHTSYMVSLETRGGWAFEREFSAGTYETLNAGDRVAALSVAGIPGSEAVGNVASMHGLVLATFVIFPLGTCAFYAGVLYRMRPWWEFDLIDTGNGLLELEH